MSFESELADWAVNRPGKLMVSVSGIRGIVPTGLDPVNIVIFARAFAAITGKKIVVGHDPRSTGPMVEHLLIGTLLGAGKEIIRIGLAPTPTVKAAVKLWKADAGVMISASHNPPEWNAFKFIDKGGAFFDQKRGQDLLHAIKDFRESTVHYSSQGTVTDQSGTEAHIESVLSLIKNLPEIKKARYRVVVDGVGGAGREALPALLRRMGCEVTELYCDPPKKGEFPRPPEPTPKALKAFAKAMKETGADAGFALDPDADRLVTGSAGLGAVNEEYTLPLSFLGTVNPGNIVKKGIIVINLSTADLVEQVASPLGFRVIRSPVGEANVVMEMTKNKSVFGGEGNGGVIHPGVPSFGRDSLTGAALILSAMAARKAKSLDDLMADMPPLYMEKTKFSTAGRDPASVIRKLKEGFSFKAIDERDGLHLTFEDGSWIHARPSNTEPVFRVIVQSRSAKGLKSILDQAALLTG